MAASGCPHRFLASNTASAIQIQQAISYFRIVTQAVQEFTSHPISTLHAAKRFLCRTTRSIRAFRTPGDLVVIPNDAKLRDFRTGVESYRFPAALRIMARTNPNMFIFEYRGETLYTNEAHGLIEATTEVELDPLLEL